MKYLLAIIVFLNGCATTKTDKLQDNLPQYVTDCRCLLQPTATMSHNVDWQDKKALKKQFQACKCTVEFGFDDVDNPLVYMKPGTTFYQEKGGFPWDPSQRRIEQVHE